VLVDPVLVESAGSSNAPPDKEANKKNTTAPIQAELDEYMVGILVRGAE